MKESECKKNEDICKFEEKTCDIKSDKYNLLFEYNKKIYLINKFPTFTQLSYKLQTNYDKTELTETPLFANLRLYLKNYDTNTDNQQMATNIQHMIGIFNNLKKTDNEHGPSLGYNLLKKCLIYL